MSLISTSLGNAVGSREAKSGGRNCAGGGEVEGWERMICEILERREGGRVSVTRFRGEFTSAIQGRRRGGEGLDDCLESIGQPRSWKIS